MTNQIQGEILYKGIDETSGTAVYTPWMPVRGDVATFGVEVVQKTSGLTFEWSVETRTRESSSITTIVSTQTPSSTGADLAKSTTDAQELVRYRFETGSGASTTEWVVFRALQPSWEVDR